MKVLIADDEKILARTIAEFLDKNKIASDVAYDGEEAVAYALTCQYDVIILDIMMPKLNGYEVLKVLRGKKISIPILMLSAKSETGDKVEGLNTGADDYLTKPFAPAELMARLKALTRRKGEYVGNSLKYGDLALNRDSFELISGDNKIKLSAKEFSIMEMLLLSPKIVFSKDRIFEKIWGYDSESEYNSVEVYVSFLRKKLAAIGSNVSIKALRGAGYTLEEGIAENHEGGEND